MNTYVKGQITVFLSLMITLIVSLLLTVIEGARVQAIRFQTECVADMAIQSALAEYHRELLSQYDLLLLDTSYGQGQGKVQNTEAHIKAYMDANFKLTEENKILSHKDWLKLTTKEVAILQGAVATDENAACVMAQILTYMSGKVGADLLEDFLKQKQGIEGEDILQYDVTGKRRAVESEIDAIGLPKKQLSDEKWEEVPLDNPADNVNATRGTGVLALVTDGASLSSQSINLQNYASHRVLNEGSGLSLHIEPQESILTELIFGEYLLEKYSPAALYVATNHCLHVRLYAKHNFAN